MLSAADIFYNLYSTIGIVDQYIKLPILLLRDSVKQIFYILIFAVVTLYRNAFPSPGLHL